MKVIGKNSVTYLIALVFYMAACQNSTSNSDSLYYSNQCTQNNFAQFAQILTNALQSIYWTSYDSMATQISTIGAALETEDFDKCFIINTDDPSLIWNAANNFAGQPGYPCFPNQGGAWDCQNCSIQTCNPNGGPNGGPTGNSSGCAPNTGEAGWEPCGTSLCPINGAQQVCYQASNSGAGYICPLNTQGDCP